MGRGIQTRGEQSQDGRLLEYAQIRLNSSTNSIGIPCALRAA